jgi:N-acylneuraminate cytidylyltransferase
MKIYAFIFVRGGSKGVPGKNIRSLGGKPLLAHSIETARQVPVIQEVFVSTDDEAIADVARKWNAIVIPRPLELAQDDSPEWLAWRHAIEWVDKEAGGVDVFVSLPATAPLRHAEDIIHCISEYQKGDVDVVVTVTDAHRSPYFNMVKNDPQGYVSLVNTPSEAVWRRQDVPEVFDMTTVAYVARPQFVMKSDGIFEGRVRSVHVPVERALDIDTELDFKIAECLLEHRESNKE